MLSKSLPKSIIRTGEETQKSLRLYQGQEKKYTIILAGTNNNYCLPLLLNDHLAAAVGTKDFEVAGAGVRARLATRFFQKV